MIHYLHVSIFDNIPKQDVRVGIAVDICSRMMHTVRSTSSKAVIFAWLLENKADRRIERLVH